MAKDVTNDINYWLSVAANQKADLASIRHWSNLKIAFERDRIWVKDFTVVQIDSGEVKSIPFIKRYEVRGPKLFEYGSRLPDATAPSLLWSPIERGLPIELPKFNFNYFGTEEKIQVRITSSNQEREAFAMIVNIEELKKYVLQAPEIRLKNLQWTIVNQGKVIILGQPLLPIPGKALWRQDDFLIPAGYEFNHRLLVKTINRKLNPNSENYIFWNTDSTHFKINKIDLQPLSISSFRMSTLV